LFGFFETDSPVDGTPVGSMLELEFDGDVVAVDETELEDVTEPAIKQPVSVPWMTTTPLWIPTTDSVPAFTRYADKSYVPDGRAMGLHPIEVVERGTEVTVLLNGVAAGARRAIVREFMGVVVGRRVVDGVDVDRGREDDVDDRREEVVLVRSGVVAELEILDEDTAAVLDETVVVVAYGSISFPAPNPRTHQLTDALTNTSFTSPCPAATFPAYVHSMGTLWHALSVGSGLNERLSDIFAPFPSLQILNLSVGREMTCIVGLMDQILTRKEEDACTARSCGSRIVIPKT
jgi:hypothetical protein